MIGKIVGYKRSAFTANDGTQVSGMRIFLIAELSGNNAKGYESLSLYLSDAKLANIGYTVSLNDEVEIYYNRYGKPESITVVK